MICPTCSTEYTPLPVKQRCTCGALIPAVTAPEPELGPELRTSVTWAPDGAPEVSTVEAEPPRLAELKLRIPQALKRRIEALAKARGLSMNLWCAIQLHARVCGEEEAAGN